MKALSRSGLRGFTLLEVMVAIAILGLGLSVILSSQVGLFSSAARTETLSQVTGLARCKMGDIELKLDKDGYPIAEEDDEGSCCGDDDEDFKRYTCSWKIQPVQLPEANNLAETGDGGVTGDQGDLGPLGALAGLQQSGGASLGADAGLGGLAGLMTGGDSTGGGASGGMQGMASLVMGMVYPDLKPMLEASIRKVTVTVHWKEGKNARTFEVTQYLTNPQQGGLDPNAANGLPSGPGLPGGGNPTGGSNPSGGGTPQRTPILSGGLSPRGATP